MFEERSGLVGYRGPEILIALSQKQPRSFDEWNRLVQDPDVAGSLDIMRDGESQPYPIIRDACTHTLTERGRPPMLDIAFGELPGCRAQQMFAGHRGVR